MIPDYQTVMLPLLKYAEDKKEHHIRDAIEGLADEFKLTEEERKELLVKMGYGGSRQDTGKAIGKSNDEGIDGIIKEDKLGLDRVYIFIKRRNGRIPLAVQKYISSQVLYRVREQEKVFL
jgi:restriction endonuclease Mrr